MITLKYISYEVILVMYIQTTVLKLKKCNNYKLQPLIITLLLHGNKLNKDR